MANGSLAVRLPADHFAISLLAAHFLLVFLSLSLSRSHVVDPHSGHIEEVANVSNSF